MKTLRLLLLMLLLWGGAQAQMLRTIVVTGYVVPASPNTNISGLNVFLMDTLMGGAPHMVTTNSNGWFMDSVMVGSSGMISVWMNNCNGQMLYNFLPYNSATTSLTTTFNYCANSTAGCHANFTFNQQGSTVAFINTSATIGGVTSSYSWNFGDGSTSTQASPIHAYANPGVYVACLTLVNGTCTSTYCDSILVTSPTGNCHANFTHTNTNSLFTFTNTSTGVNSATTYLWHFGDGSTSTLANPTHSYAINGLYSVCLTIATGNCTSTFCDSIQVGAPITYAWAYGNISGPSTNGNMVQVFLYDNNSFQIVDSTYAFPDSLGNGFMYNFSSIPSGSYLVLATLTPSSVDFSNYVASYYGNPSSSASWMNASPAIVTVNGSNTFNINMMAINAMAAGTGSISGTILRGNWRTNAGVLANTRIYLRDANQTIRKQTRSTATGAFTFSNVAMGNYTLWVEYPGRTMVAVPVSLTTANPSVAGLNFTVNLNAITTGVEEAAGFEFKGIYPNPVQDQANLQLNVTQNGVYTFRILDVAGRNVSTSVENLNNGSHTLNLNTSELSRGMYFIQITDPQSKSLSFRFVK